MERTPPRDCDSHALVRIPGLGDLDIAIIRSLLESAGFFFTASEAIGEVPGAICVRAADLAAIKEFLRDYRTIGSLWRPGGPISW